MRVKEKRDSSISPELLKFGVVLAFSLGGIVYTFLRSKRFVPFKPKSSISSPGKGSNTDSRMKRQGNDHDQQNISIPIASNQNSISDLSSDGRLTGDKDLIKECNNTSVKLTNDIAPKCDEPDEHELEIEILRRKVKILEEREKLLEIQLLEYYGLEEQECAVMELQNRLQLSNMEAKLYAVKIESLQSDKRRLEAQVADYAKVEAELEAAKAKITVLRKKLRCEAEQNREQILKLQERVMKLQDQETGPVEIDRDVEMQIRKNKELEEELSEVKKINHGMKMENLELAQKLEYVQTRATSVLENKEMQALKEESHLLKQQNSDLRKEIEQIQADRCTDLEELVYLRWINACLRYEMRNYQPAPGETIARDLSKTLSPKSEEKAKQLILEYANKEGGNIVNFNDFDSDQWSSYFTDSGETETDDLTNENSTAGKSKTRVLAKLRKLLRGTSSGGSSGESLDLQRSYSRGPNGESGNCSRRMSEDGLLNIFRSMDSITGYDDQNSTPVFQPHENAQNEAKLELAKYAEALKKSRVTPPVRRRSASTSF